MPLLHGDISNAACALLMVAPDMRRRICAQMVADASQAVEHVRRTGRLHPRYGNGSLMAAARARGIADEPGFNDPDYCSCVIEVLKAVMRYRETEGCHVKDRRDYKGLAES